ncbi:hypothetical protein BC936DRAFT_149403, partial [Jimgerdemannia flammicorona]
MALRQWRDYTSPTSTSFTINTTMSATMNTITGNSYVGSRFNPSRQMPRMLAAPNNIGIDPNDEHTSDVKEFTSILGSYSDNTQNYYTFGYNPMEDWRGVLHLYDRNGIPGTANPVITGDRVI